MALGSNQPVNVPLEPSMVRFNALKLGEQGAEILLKMAQIYDDPHVRIAAAVALVRLALEFPLAIPGGLTLDDLSRLTNDGTKLVIEGRT